MIRILVGDCRERLRELPDASVHCCVTSPPYFGLRDYGTAQWDGGSPDCDHRQKLGGDGTASVKQTTSGGTQGYQYREQCGKCGATRIDRQMGLEPTPDEFVAGIVEVFREVRRVLRDDGTLWLNIGDSYNNFRVSTNGQSLHKGDVRGKFEGRRPVDNRLKEKDLIGIPWRLAFALQADGWYLRQDIIWSKPNPMPESVRDRCTKAHEYLFLLSKGPRYYYDAEAIAEPVSLGTHGGAWNEGGVKQAAIGQQRGGRLGNSLESGTRNKRSVWEVATQPFSEAHFATFPPGLIEPCVLAGCPKGGTVLDPFGGAGTTGLVADRLQRDAILVELNPEYAAMARQRIEGDASLLTQVAAE